jgi:hypothetical protein
MTATGGGSVVDAGDGGDGAPRCNESKSPAEEPCLVSDEHAVFVSQGAVNGTGTKESPLGSIAEGMVAAKGAHLKRIIVCNATYAENVMIQGTDGALSIYGGFTCPAASGDAGADWTSAPGVHAVVSPPTGVPLTITGATSKIVVSGIDFVAADAPQDASSIGGIVAMSTDVTLVDVNVTAGKGGVGSDGDPGKNGDPGADWRNPPLPPGLTLTAAGDATCSATPPVMPPVGASWNKASGCSSQGGGGGNTVYNSQGQDGQNGIPQGDVVTPSLKNGGAAAIEPGQDKPGSPGTAPGSDGVSGVNGMGAAAFGTFSADGYSPADGHGGTDGYTAQGGGGGGASFGANGCTGAGGGVGGMGGCGGTHGEGGKGGGASVSLISWNSGLVLDAVQLVSRDGGVGGKGGKQGLGGVGGPGTDGGVGVSGKGVGRGGAGTPGGTGGYAGSGSGGTGGPSYALVFHGTPPTEINLPAPQYHNGGAMGPGGEVVAVGAPPAPDGAVGGSAARYPVTP